MLQSLLIGEADASMRRRRGVWRCAGVKEGWCLSARLRMQGGRGSDAAVQINASRYWDARSRWMERVSVRGIVMILGESFSTSTSGTAKSESM